MRLSQGRRLGQKRRMDAAKDQGSTQELTVQRMGAQGDGVAVTPRGPVFVPLTLPGERVRVRVGGDLGGGRGELVEVLEPSAERVPPASPHYGACGGCSLQHWAQAPYLAWKREQVRELLAREGLETEIAPVLAFPAGTRRRLALHARRGAKGIVILGFKGRRSWTVLPRNIRAPTPGGTRRLASCIPPIRLASNLPLREEPEDRRTALGGKKTCRV